MSFLWSFVVGGVLCAIGQLLVDKTNLTPARILVCYVISGVFLTLIGVYEPVVKLAGSGATVPLTGFGYALCNGVIKAVKEQGFLGIFTGGLTATAAGITVATVFGLIIALIFKPKEK